MSVLLLVLRPRAGAEGLPGNHAGVHNVTIAVVAGVGATWIAVEALWMAVEACGYVIEACVSADLLYCCLVLVQL